MKILLCDKENIILKLLSRELSEYGYEMLTANNGFDGMNMVRKHKPDIIITDLFLPLVNGLEYIEMISKELPNSDIIVYSDVIASNMVEQCYRLGAKDVIPKPIDPKRFILRLKRLEFTT